MEKAKNPQESRHNIKKELLFMIFLLILNMNRITAIFSVELL